MPTTPPSNSTPATSGGDALAGLTRVTEALRALGRRSASVPVEQVLVAVETALAGTFASRCGVWEISTDGTRMRSPSGQRGPWNHDAVTPRRGGGPDPLANDGEQALAWFPAIGPVADVLGVKQPIELGLPGPVDDASISSTSFRSFARVAPVWHRGRIAAVVAVVRDAPLPMFSAVDRSALEAICERIESAYGHQDLRDELISTRTSPIVVSSRTISEELFNALSIVGGDIVFRHRFGAGTEYVSGGVRTVLGYTPEEFQSDPGLARRIVHPEDRYLLGTLQEDRSAFDHQHLLRTVTRDGTVVWQLVRIRPVLDGDRIIGLEGLATDVSMMKRTEAELSHQARSDPLTSLANRLTLYEFANRSLARLVRHPGMVGMLYLDLTGFKQVNDTLGHPAGDQAIRTVAERLSKVTRREDVVARVGGDEFAVLMPDLNDVSDATATAQRIIAAIESPIEVHGAVARISTGVGIVVITNPTLTVDEVLGQADNALLQAKRAGRGRWQVFQGIGGTLTGPDRDGGKNIDRSGLITAGAVRTAFAAGQFTVQYLPVVDVRTGSAEAVEALLRWDHPDLGMLDADDFLQACEEADLIHTIDDWVLAQSCREVAIWNELLLRPMSLGINVTAGKLALPGFGESVLATLAATGLSASSLTIEVPEPSVTDLSAAEVVQLESLRRAGPRISIDRFGLGSTSLRALRRLPIDEIKIDRTLVATLDPSRSATDVDVEITKLAMQVSQSFGASTVAVGVERSEQVTALLELGCHLMQGHLFDKPTTAAHIRSQIADGVLSYAHVLRS